MSAAPAVPTTTSGIEALPMTLPRLAEKKRQSQRKRDRRVDGD